MQVAVELPLSARAELADMELMESDAREESKHSPCA